MKKFKKQQVISVLIGSPVGANRIFIIDPVTKKELASISQDGVVTGQKYRINIEGKFVDISSTLRQLLDINKQFEEVKEKIKALDSGLSKTNAQVYTLEGLVTGLTSWGVSVEARLNPLLTTVAALGTTVTGLQAEILELRGRIDTCENTLNDHENRIRNIERDDSSDISIDRLTSGSLENKDTDLNVYANPYSTLEINPKKGIFYHIYTPERIDNLIRVGHPTKNDKFMIVDKEEGDYKDLCGLTADGSVLATNGFFLWNEEAGRFKKEISANYLGSGSLTVNKALIEVARYQDEDGKLKHLLLIGYESGITHQHFVGEGLVDDVIIGHQKRNNQFMVYDYEGTVSQPSGLLVLGGIGHDGIIWGRDFQRWNRDIDDFDDFYVPFSQVYSGKLKEGTTLGVHDNLLIDTDEGIQHFVNGNLACNIGSSDTPNCYMVKHPNTGGILGGIDSNGIVHARALHVRDPNGHDWLSLDQVPIKPEQLISGSVNDNVVIGLVNNNKYFISTHGLQGFSCIDTNKKISVLIGNSIDNNRFYVIDNRTDKKLGALTEEGHVYAQAYYVKDGDNWKEFKGDVTIENVKSGKIKHRYLLYYKKHELEGTDPSKALELTAFINDSGLQESYREIIHDSVETTHADIRIGNNLLPNQFTIRNKDTGEMLGSLEETGDVYASNYYIKDGDDWRTLPTGNSDGSVRIDNVLNGNVKHEYKFEEGEIEHVNKKIKFSAKLHSKGFTERSYITEGENKSTQDDIRIGNISKANQFTVRNKKTGEVLAVINDKGDIYAQKSFVKVGDNDWKQIDLNNIKISDIKSGDIKEKFDFQGKDINILTDKTIQFRSFIYKNGLIDGVLDENNVLTGDVIIGNPNKNNSFIIRDKTTGTHLGGIDGGGVVRASQYQMLDKDGNWIPLPIGENDGVVKIDNVLNGNIKHKYNFGNYEIRYPDKMEIYNSFIHQDGFKDTITLVDQKGGTVFDDTRIGDPKKANQFVVRNRQTNIVDTILREDGIIDTRALQIMNSATNKMVAKIANDGKIFAREITIVNEVNKDNKTQFICNTKSLNLWEKDNNNSDFKRKLHISHEEGIRFNHHKVSGIPNFLSPLVWNIKNEKNEVKNLLSIEPKLGIIFDDCDKDGITTDSLIEWRDKDKNSLLKVGLNTGIRFNNYNNTDLKLPPITWYKDNKLLLAIDPIEGIGLTDPKSTDRDNQITKGTIIKHHSIQVKNQTPISGEEGGLIIAKDYININSDIGIHNKTFKSLVTIGKNIHEKLDQNPAIGNPGLFIYKSLELNKSIIYSPFLKYTTIYDTGKKDKNNKPIFEYGTLFDITTYKAPEKDAELYPAIKMKSTILTDKNTLRTKEFFSVGHQTIKYHDNIIADENGIAKRPFEKKTDELEISNRIHTTSKRVELNQDFITVGNVDIRYGDKAQGSIHIKDFIKSKGLYLDKDHINITSYKTGDEILNIDYDAIKFRGHIIADEKGLIEREFPKDSIFNSVKIVEKTSPNAFEILNKDDIPVANMGFDGVFNSKEIQTEALKITKGYFHLRDGLIHIKDKENKEILLNKGVINIKQETPDGGYVTTVNRNGFFVEDIREDKNGNQQGISIGQERILINRRVSFGMSAPSEILNIAVLPTLDNDVLHKEDVLRLNIDKRYHEMSPSLIMDHLTISGKSKITKEELFKINNEAITFWGHQIANKDGIVAPETCQKCETLENKMSILEAKIQEQGEKISQLFGMIT